MDILRKSCSGPYMYMHCDVAFVFLAHWPDYGV